MDYEFAVTEETPLFAEQRVQSVKVHFDPVVVDRQFGVRLGDLSNISSDISLGNRDLLQFLDIATSQEIFFRK